jgi:spoIIIJ-associated protein
MVNKQIERRASIVLDVEGYRQRRERQLRDLAKRMADRVARDGRTAVLEPMPAHERRIVHLALRDHPAVTTYSVGDGDRRKVTIRLKR